MAVEAVLFLVSVIYTMLSFGKTEKIARRLGGAFLFCALLQLDYIILLSTEAFAIKEYMACLQYVFMDWTVLLLFFYCMGYVKISLKKSYMIIAISIVTVDCLIFLTNPLNNLAVQMKPYEYSDIQTVAEKVRPLFLIHPIICYSLNIIMIIALIMKCAKTQRLYRGKYIVVVAIVFSNMIGFLFDVPELVRTVILSCFMTTFELVAIYVVSYNIPKKNLANRLHAYVADNISDATILYDNEGQLINLNHRASDLFEKDICETSDKLLTYLGFPESDGVYKKKIRDGIYNISCNSLRDENGNVLGKTFIFYDITEVEAQIEREHTIAITDSLTGAYNRLGFLEASNEFLYHNESESGFVMIVSGIQNFKGLNAAYGTRAGDMVLKYIERRFYDYHLSYSMVYGRTAEGKYAVLAPFEAVEDITSGMTCIDVPVDEDLNIHVDMCHGYIVLDDIGKPLDYYYERALLALSDCKRTLSLTSLEYSYEMEERVQKRQFLVTQMHEALREKQFFIELQPQINLDTREVSGAEALVRWKHPKLGRISPAEFIPLFEENGFIVDLDVYVWEKAAMTAKELSDKGIYDGSISINISQIDIMNTDVAAALDRIVKKVGIPPSKLHVEITESACVDRRETLIKTLNSLREKGFIIEIDDFGSGYSSLNVLMSLPFDVVKLDMGFTRDNSLEGRSGIVITTIAKMIHDLDAIILVEGVETEKHVENTVAFGGDIVQGYYFSRPLQIDQFCEFVQKKK